MIFRFPLKDVSIIVTRQKTKVALPLYSDEWNEINQQEYTLDEEGVAWFYARNGNYIEVCPYEYIDQHTLELYLNGSVYGAILLQRMIVPLHGSCFSYLEKGIMICGESGAGKSSLTAAFCLNGAGFLTDDITPVIIKNNKPYILTLSDRIKLWDDSLEQLNISKVNLLKIEPDTEKFYYPIDTIKPDSFLLRQIFVLEIHDETTIELHEIRGVEKLTMIRNQIYRMEYLQGMPENESAFFQNLAVISKNVKVLLVKRPAATPIQHLMNLLKNHIV